MEDIWYLDEFDFERLICPIKYDKLTAARGLTTLRKNDALFDENDPANELLLIDRGIVKLVRYDTHGAEQVLTFLVRGDVLGLMALVGQSKHRVRAVAMQNNTQVCRIGVDEVHKLVRLNVDFANEVHRRIDGYVHKLERQVQRLLCKSVRLRIIELLRDLAEEYGTVRGSGIVIKHELTQTDIATLVATSRKSTSLILNALEQEGHLQFTRKQLHILDRERFARLKS